MFFYTFFSIVLLGAFLCAYKISVADFRRRIIPDAYLFPLLLLGLITVNFFPWVCTPTESIIGAVFGYTLSSIIGIIFEKIKKDKINTPIGMGDIKLMATGGIWCGTTGLAISLIFSCIFGTIWGHTKKQKFIPFAPFFLTGVFLSLFILRFLLSSN